MAKNTTFHKKPFDKGTKTKIEIFDAYLKEALPVFIHQKYWKKIFIYDLFAGKGLNENGEYGTALNILKGVSKYCKNIIENQKNLYVILNDKKEKEFLAQNVNKFLENCKITCENKNCILDDKHLIIKDNDFREYFNKTIFPNLKKTEAMKLMFLDPFNFIMDSKLFNNLISLPQTDFMCFIPATFLRRFPTEPTFKKFIDDYGLSFTNTKFKESHRIIAKYIRNLIPNDKEYYIGHFSIEKSQEKGNGKNYYGLIFGSNHIFAAEKFQNVCWKLDPTVGEADYNIDDEITYDDNAVLFDIPTSKISKFEEELSKKILNAEFKTDIDVYKYAIKNCFLPKHAAAILKQMMQDKRINEFKTHNSNIHKIINSPNDINIL